MLLHKNVDAGVPPMSSNRDKIQALIAEIDGVMPKMTSRIAWWMSGDARRVLERVRTYLVSLQHEDRASSSTSGAQTNSEVLSSPKHPADAPGELDRAKTAWREAIEQEISLLRAGLMQPLLSEIAALRQERETLAQEIRQLEINRHHQYSLAQQQSAQQQLLADWLQGLMSRLQESLKEQVARSLMQLESNLLSYEGGSPKQLTAPNQASALSREKVPPESAHPLLDPQTRLEHLRMLQSESDGLLISLDATLRAVFESIERNLHAYEQSMSDSVEKMYRLGQQGEVIFARLIGQMSQPNLLGSTPGLDTAPQTPEVDTQPAASKAPSAEFIRTESTPIAPVSESPPSSLEVLSAQVSAVEALLFTSPPPLGAPTASPSSVEFPFAGTEFINQASRPQPPTTDFFGDGVEEIVASDLPEAAPEDTDQLLKADVTVVGARLHQDLSSQLDIDEEQPVPMVEEESAVDAAIEPQAASESAVTDVDDRLVVTAATPSVVSTPQSRPKAEETDLDLDESLLVAAGATPPSAVPPSVAESQDIFREMTAPPSAAPLPSDVAEEEEYLSGGMAEREPAAGWDWDFAPPKEPPKENVTASAPVVETPQPEAVALATSLEAFLFGDAGDATGSPPPPLPTDESSLDSALPRTEPSVATAAESRSALADGSAATTALNDLFGDLGAEATDTEVSQLADEDVAYLAALPEEDLLADREPKAGSNSQLWLNTSALKQLSEDLSSLETASSAEAEAAKDQSEAMLDEMLERFTSAPPDVANVPGDGAASKDDMFDWPDNSGAVGGTDAPPTSVSDMEIGMENENPPLAADEAKAETVPTALPSTASPSAVLAEPKPEEVTVDDIFADLMAASSTPSPSAPQIEGTQMVDVVSESQSQNSSLDDFFDGFASSGQMSNDAVLGSAIGYQMSASLRGDKSMSDWLPEPEAPEASDIGDSTLDDFFASLGEDKPNR